MVNKLGLHTQNFFIANVKFNRYLSKKIFLHKNSWGLKKLKLFVVANVVAKSSALNSEKI